MIKVNYNDFEVIAIYEIEHKFIYKWASKVGSDVDFYHRAAKKSIKQVKKRLKEEDLTESTKILGFIRNSKDIKTPDAFGLMQAHNTNDLSDIRIAVAFKSRKDAVEFRHHQSNIKTVRIMNNPNMKGTQQ